MRATTLALTGLMVLGLVALAANPASAVAICSNVVHTNCADVVCRGYSNHHWQECYPRDVCDMIHCFPPCDPGPCDPWE